MGILPICIYTENVKPNKQLPVYREVIVNDKSGIWRGNYVRNILKWYRKYKALY